MKILSIFLLVFLGACELEFERSHPRYQFQQTGCPDWLGPFDNTEEGITQECRNQL